ncbi:MAG: hypothetical protein LC676_18505, partial [Loktanella sp.]|nr:hypothetical protein [Loktanella sp.]
QKTRAQHPGNPDPVTISDHRSTLTTGDTLHPVIGEGAWELRFFLRFFLRRLAGQCRHFCSSGHNDPFICESLPRQTQ